MTWKCPDMRQIAPVVTRLAFGVAEVCAGLHNLAGRPTLAAGFLKINCAAFSDSLLESQLFGNTRRPAFLARAATGRRRAHQIVPAAQRSAFFHRVLYRNCRLDALPGVAESASGSNSGSM